jgi:hypothetical protein
MASKAMAVTNVSPLPRSATAPKPRDDEDEAAHRSECFAASVVGSVGRDAGAKGVEADPREARYS